MLDTALTIRPLESEAEKRAAFALFRRSILILPDLARLAPDLETRFLAQGAPIGAFENDELLGTVNGYPGEIALPGGEWVRHLGVTHVGTAPHATRRGVARRLLSHQLQAARLQGYAVAGLRASDARIYGRYGYGIGSQALRIELDLSRSRLAVPTRRDELRPVDPLADLPLLQRIAAETPARRGAQLRRWDSWWAMQEFRTRNGATPHHAITLGPKGRERGYLRFHPEPSDNWLVARDRGVIIDDLIAHDAAAYRDLIGHLYAQDIIHRATFPSRPLDDALPLLIDDPRAVTLGAVKDESWLRILDLPGLLAKRHFGEGAAVVVSVTDEILPANSGQWRLGPEAGATSERADLQIGIGDLASLLFGALEPQVLADAGRITAPDSVIERLARLTTVSRKPHAGIAF
ncbi:GNAT family N-acetyltransferase [Paracoccus aminophilus]|uniref:N-acetyltransferase domain-containing protein n=1 Tax=Paracoccus aminophilus JCM 7686 TaxID=1367847 RepID=S5XTF6_PARAH|nr:GNAT family N-acetyltransferase [Paracoccus aminophilus]AGT10789.1 hypothetical protein JCM7686_pAMI4p098 [Paracoccus aminophilus JCM 7686]